MTSRWLFLVFAWLALAPIAHAQDTVMKDAVTTQQHRAGAPTEADLMRRLNRRLIDIARKFWLSARADGLQFEDVVTNIGLRNAAMADFGLPLQVIRRENDDQFAVTSRTSESRRRVWVSLSGTSPENGIDLTAIDGEMATTPALMPDGNIDPACRFRVVFANGGEHDERGHDDYAKSYPCIDFLSGALDAQVIADLKRWAADLVRRTAQ
jgi:hypothetical protein